jgi:prephenate dehydrogenase
MPVQITIVGLGLIGASAGLALGEHKDQLTRVGHDKDFSRAKLAQKLGAVDKIQFNLPASVDEAGIVLIATPLSGVRETLEIIGPDLKEGSAVMDTAPVKEPVIGWAKEFIPAGRHYVGLNPSLNPGRLLEIETGTEAARADLFERGLMGIVAPPGTASEAVKLAADLSTLLGAAPFFLDAAENDSLTAAVHTLPQLMAASLLGATAGKPGWPEARKLTGRAYAGVTGALMSGGQIANLNDAALANRTNTVRLLEAAIQSLQELRDVLEMDEGAQFTGLLDRLVDARLAWWSEREKASWAEEQPAPQQDGNSISERLGQMLMGGFAKKRKVPGGKDN